MTGKRIAVAGLAAAVLAAIVVLAISATSSSADKARKVNMTEATGKTEVIEGTPAPRTIARPAAAEPDATDDEPKLPAGDDYVEHVRDDGTVVRDHRGGEAPQIERKVTSTTSIKVRRDVRPLFKECGKQLRRRDRQARGRVQAVVTTSIKNGMIKVDALDLQIQGLEDSEYTDCVRKEVEGVELYAPDGQADVDKQTMTFQFTVP